ncbi:MAG: fructose-specific PTS transporter subunit EIIC, partial [Actinomycetota bacterium]|nr:fructose-specific PTS transporter subunit EIIC [Actinomycetota bacterium]
MKIVAVTSCPTGIAHTYMAAESLEQAALAAGHEIVVETQGAAGAEPLSAHDIATADVAVFAADVEVRDRDRFAGLPVVAVGVKRAINDAAGLVAEAESAAVARPGRTTAAAAPVALPTPHLGIRLRQWLMTGVSYMIPFVAAGGILIALGFLLGGDEVVTKLYGGTFHGIEYKAVAGSVPSGIDPQVVIDQAGYAGLLFVLGKFAFFMLVPVLSGYIAFAMADRPGLVPGVVGGLLASAIGAGFLGGLASGLLAGAVVLALARIKVPRAMAGVMPVVVIPLVSTIVVGFGVLLVLDRPITSATTHLTSGLDSLSGRNAIVLGLVLGLMMAFDMGGPVNKVAYTFGVAGLSAGNTEVMAAVMAAGMTPPIAMALATVLRPKLFSDAERKAGEAGWLLGASFITEGAIPFAAADPLRVIPSLMAGSAVTGALSMAFHATSRAPHGGVFVVGLVGKPVLYL